MPNKRGGSTPPIGTQRGITMNEDKVTMLIACGPNSIEVPCRIFPDMETAKTKCDEIFGIEGTPGESGYTYKVDLEDEKKPWPISNELFTEFYYGCGGPYPFVLVEVEFDTKFVGFNLD